MKRRLIVMRHAKSSWKSGAKTDHERPLNKRGRRDSKRVARHLRREGWVPQIVLSSDSERTRQTADLLHKHWDHESHFEFINAFYHGGIDEVVAEVSAVPDDIECVLVLGHNPGWEGVLVWLTGEDERLTTANAALLLGDALTWREAMAQRRAWQIHDIVRPKELAD